MKDISQTDYEKFPLTTEKAQLIMEKLDVLMKNEKPFLNSQLTLAELAGYLDIPTFHLSRVFNEYLKQNYFDFINKLRVEEVMRMLRDHEFDHFDVATIGLKAGFNSSETFLRVFYYFNKMTPSQYREHRAADL